MTGIIGAVAMAFHGKDFGSRGQSLVGDEIAMGRLAQNDKPEPSALELMLMMTMVGKD